MCQSHEERTIKLELHTSRKRMQENSTSQKISATTNLMTTANLQISTRILLQSSE